MKIQNHKIIGTTVEQIACPKNNKLFSTAMPDTLIIHYTAGRSAESSVNFLAKDSVKASAHLVVGRDGKIFQLVDFNKIAWHAGVSEYAGRSGFNAYSIGIELDNAGPLQKTGDQYKSWFGKNYPEEEVVKAKHRNENTEKYWHAYTEEQITACYSICELLIDSYPQIKYMLGHEEISPGRKTDPGPAFPLDKFRNRLLYNDRQSEEFTTELNGLVNASALNIRSGPGANFETIAAPLTNHTRLRITAQSDGWYQVKTEITGWVSKEYVKIND